MIVDSHRFPVSDEHEDRLNDIKNEEEDIIMPEVLPPEEASHQEPSRFRRAERAFGPVIAGIILDAVDLATFGPMGILFGMLLGGSVVFYICSIYRLPMKQRLLWALAGGAYCTMPLTEFLPVATLVGAYIRYRESANEAQRRSPPSS